MKAAPRPEDRAAPLIPPAGRVLRTLIDTDAKAEIDDLYAIALAMLSPERFRDRGLCRLQLHGRRRPSRPRSRRGRSRP